MKNKALYFIESVTNLQNEWIIHEEGCKNFKNITDGMSTFVEQSITLECKHQNVRFNFHKLQDQDEWIFIECTHDARNIIGYIKTDKLQKQTCIRFLQNTFYPGNFQNAKNTHTAILGCCSKHTFNHAKIDLESRCIKMFQQTPIDVIGDLLRGIRSPYEILNMNTKEMETVVETFKACPIIDENGDLMLGKNTIVFPPTTNHQRMQCIEAATTLLPLSMQKNSDPV